MSGVWAHTYSIVGRCERTGELGVAVASAVPAVGAICPYLRPGVGAVSTQSWVNPYLAVAVLDRLAAGAGAADAVAATLAEDPAAAVRQLGAIGAGGAGAAHTGADCTAACGHACAADHAVQGNMLTGVDVLEAMSRAFAAGPGLPLDERLLAALEAAQAAGGDKRGRQSAALVVTGSEIYPRVDLRVDEHADPVAELRRVHGVAASQLAPFVAGMPRRGGPAAAAPAAVTEMLLKPPPQRPGGGGSDRP
ncbi:DUF1028 domain-containing protein [Paralimibaculum aggregatum]|uniref:DUF1028 domain-containing protein n=1 Tax=Paralimibaculum aggregatum TaxID=3036245 RepID=A0ABQ6LK81_9RHOB|nr:DUF1028 domain-containing protein [Limibaculum sp. NKW23]GMG82640.1 DUF1028 domain-containing protein [Limibaculum sp. NKW23]